MLIKSVQISNYRTLKKLESNFIPGLNVIIGDNGSGKTNFLKLLSSVLSFNKKSLSNYPQFKCTISFYEDCELSIENNVSLIESETDSDTKGDNLFYNLKQNGLVNQLSSKKDLNDYLDKIDVPSFVQVNIGHGMPGRPILFLSEPFNGVKRINVENDITDQIFSLLNDDLEKFWQMPFSNFLKFEFTVSTENLDEIKEKWSNILLETCKYFTNIFKRCSFITDVRISPSYSLDWDSVSSELSVKNLFFEFYQNDRWNHFSELSDGTMRIISILMSVVDYETFVLSKKEFKEVTTRKRDKIVIIEEPELGINPHQLYKLMLVLKEEAKTKQIIITTHSPITLDIFEKDELDSILICTYDSKNRTKISPLTAIEKSKALGYMEKVGYLSLYWSHADLQRN